MKSSPHPLQLNPLIVTPLPAMSINRSFMANAVIMTVSLFLLYVGKSRYDRAVHVMGKHS